MLGWHRVSALIDYYALKVAQLSGVVSTEEVWAYLSLLCGEANEDESKKPSLDDFIDKLIVLRYAKRQPPAYRKLR